MAAKRKVLIGPSSFAQSDGAPLRRLRDAGFEVVPNPVGRKLTKTELLALLPGAIGIVAGLEPLTRDVLTGSDLKVISRCGAGMSNVDLEAARELGIEVRNTPDAPTVAVAELAVGALVSLLRHLPHMDRQMHEGQWDRPMGRQIQGKTVAIIGAGRIGLKVASLLRPFGARVLAVDPALTGDVEGIERTSLDRALAEADIVSLHASGDVPILDAAAFDRLKPGALVMNLARGMLVNEAALCRALDAGIVAGAYLDTFAEEPYSGPLARYSQVILTPHVGSLTAECRSQMELEAVGNLLAVMRSHDV
jgi:D-3-phosphoglycerate dehydrogenase